MSTRAAAVVAITKGDQEVATDSIAVRVEVPQSVLSISSEAQTMAVPDPNVIDPHDDVIAAFKEIAVRAASVCEAQELEELLRLVGHSVCKLLQVRRFFVYLRNDDGSFSGQVGFSSSSGVDQQVRRLTTGGDRFTQEIVSTRTAVLARDACNDPRTLQSTMRSWGIRDMLGVPLVFGDEVIGIIYVDNESQDHDYTSAQIEVAQTFASLAALAVRQAELHTQLVHRARVIDQQRRTLQLIVDAHARLTEAFVQGAGLAGVMQILAEMIDKPVLFLTDRFEPTSVAAPDGMDISGVAIKALGHHLGPAIAKAGLARSAAMLPAEPHNGVACRQLVCPILVDDRPGGYLVVMEIGRAIRPVVEMKIIEQAATVVALQVVTERRHMDAEGQAREDLLSDLLQGGRDRSVLMRRAPLLGVALERPHVVVRLSFEADPEHAIPASKRRRHLSSRLASALSASVPLATSVPGADLLLVALTDPVDAEAMTAVKTAVQDVIDTSDCGLRIRGAAISTVLRCVDDYPRAHRELRELLEATESLGGPCRPVLVSEFGVTRFLLGDIAGNGSVEFARGTPAPLLESDAHGDGGLVATLRAYLKAGSDTRTAAQILGVHENSVRYRLRRISKISAIDPSNLDSLLDARFALQVLELVDPAGDGHADRQALSGQLLGSSDGS